jgi:hypothetical protein
MSTPTGVSTLSPGLLPRCLSPVTSQPTSHRSPRVGCVSAHPGHGSGHGCQCLRDAPPTGPDGPATAHAWLHPQAVTLDGPPVPRRSAPARSFRPVRHTGAHDNISAFDKQPSSPHAAGRNGRRWGPLGSRGAALGPPWLGPRRGPRGPAHRAQPAGKPHAAPEGPCRSALHEESALHVGWIVQPNGQHSGRVGAVKGLFVPPLPGMSPVSNLWDTLSVRVSVTEWSFVTVTFLPWFHGHRPGVRELADRDATGRRADRRGGGGRAGCRTRRTAR